ncbi:unnamed protein product, partial [Symbiodinium sp. CCMP2456]
MVRLPGERRDAWNGNPASYVEYAAPNWLSFPGGAERLLEHLRQGLGKPRQVVPRDRRRKSETSNEYLTKKSECYMRPQQATMRILPTKTDVYGVDHRRWPHSFSCGDDYSGD